MRLSPIPLLDALLLQASAIAVTLALSGCTTFANQTEDDTSRVQWCVTVQTSHVTREHYPAGSHQGVYYPNEYVAPKCHAGEHAARDCDRGTKLEDARLVQSALRPGILNHGRAPLVCVRVRASTSNQGRTNTTCTRRATSMFGHGLVQSWSANSVPEGTNWLRWGDLGRHGLGSGRLHFSPATQVG